MLAEKYKPTSLREVLDQKDLILKMGAWLDSWKSGSKALIIYGPTGTGKSTIANLIAKERGMRVFEISSNEERSALLLKEKLISSKESSLSGRRMILIDDVDSFGSSDRGGITEIISAVKESASPIVMTANDAYDQKLKSLREYCELLKTRRVPVNTIEKKLTEIASREKIRIGALPIRKIAENSRGDVRSAINDLEALNENSFRDRESNIFDVLNVIFHARDIKKASLAIDSSNKDMDEIFWWIEQNIPLEYQSKETIAQALDILSRADLFRGRIIKNQNYRFRKYMKDVMASISLIENQQRRFVMYRPPGRLMTLGATKVSRKEAEEFYRSLGMNSSMKKIKEQEPFLRLILGSKFKG